MEKQAILRADYLDILFDNRNKTYGGYDLRKTYHQRIKRALGIVLLTTASAIAYPVIASNFGNHKISEDIMHGPTVLTDLPQQIEKPPVELPKPQETQAPTQTEKITPPEIIEDDKVRQEDLLAENSKIIHAGTEKIDADPGPGIVPDNPNPAGTGIVSAPAPSSTAIEWVEQMPAYNGDMYAYLQKNLEYPEIARQTGIEGRVSVKFVVNEDGSIASARVLKGIGGGCDEEAVRVVSAMPKWSPGKNNGRAVKVYFTLPIIFKLD